MKILIVDDDPDLVEMVSHLLQRHHYSVVQAYDGKAALVLLQKEQPDLILLDVAMPGIDGWEVCSHIRARSSVPIIMLTVKGTEEDVARGLELGADDYVMKPFRPKELLARIKAVSRRYMAEGSGAEIAGLALVDRDSVKLDPAKRCVVWRGESIKLTPLEFRLLYELVRHEGQVLPYEALISRIWGYQEEGDSSLLKTHIHNLREKLEPDATSPRYIITVPGVGYTFRSGQVDVSSG